MITPAQRIATEAIRQAAMNPTDTAEQTCQRVAEATGLDPITVQSAISGTPGAPTMETTPKAKLPAITPDLTGPMGRAWKMDMTAITAKQPKGAPMSVTVASWLVYAPFAHPIFPTYQVACIHLRDIEGAAPAKIMLVGATHEVLVLAIDPTQQLALDTLPMPLYPVNFMGQFVAADDQAAASCIEGSVREIVQGTLSPDTDHSRAWMLRYSDSNAVRHQAPA